MKMWLYVLTTFLILLTAFYVHVLYKLSYWRRLGVAEEPGFFPFGSKSHWDVMLRKIKFSQSTNEVYRNHTNENMVGSYETFGNPVLIVRDLELAKHILVQDFDHFTDRRDRNVFVNRHSKNNKYLVNMLSNLKDDEWKHMRSILSPVFTSSKLKSMVPLIHQVVTERNRHLDALCGKEINGKEVTRDFSLDVIMLTAFGVKCNTFKEPENIFKHYSKTLVRKNMSVKFSLSLLLFMICPKLCKWLDIAYFDIEATEFFAHLIKTSVNERKKDGRQRNDLIDSVINAIEKDMLRRNIDTKNTEKDITDQYEVKKVKPKNIKWSTTEEFEIALISNCLMTFIISFDQVSTTSALMLLNLANNQNVQEKLYQEIVNALKCNNCDQLDYSVLMQLPYLDMVFHETLRYYPTSHLERIATKKYTIPGTVITIPKGMVVRIATPAIMKDETYYPEPEQFNPDNFSAKAKALRNPLTYSGFGHGPRHCVAMRFAILQVKMEVSTMLTNYKVLPCQKTVKTLAPDPNVRSGQPKHGIWFTVQKRLKL